MMTVCVGWYVCVSEKECHLRSLDETKSERELFLSTEKLRAKASLDSESM